MERPISRAAGSFRGGDQIHEPCDVTERAGDRRLLNPGDPCPFQLSKVELLDLAQHRHEGIAPPQLDRQPRRLNQAMATGWSLAEIRGTSQSRYRDRDCPTLPRPAGCPVKLERDLLMLARQQCSAMPCPTIRLIGQHIRQRLMRTPALPHARALRDRRTYQGMTKTERQPIDGDDACLDSRRNDLEIQHLSGDHAGCLEDLVDPASSSAATSTTSRASSGSSETRAAKARSRRSVNGNRPAAAQPISSERARRAAAR